MLFSYFMRRQHKNFPLWKYSNVCLKWKKNGGNIHTTFTKIIKTRRGMNRKNYYYNMRVWKWEDKPLIGVATYTFSTFIMCVLYVCYPTTVLCYWCSIYTFQWESFLFFGWDGFFGDRCKQGVLENRWIFCHFLLNWKTFPNIFD